MCMTLGSVTGLKVREGGLRAGRYPLGPYGCQQSLNTASRLVALLLAPMGARGPQARPHGRSLYS